MVALEYTGDLQEIHSGFTGFVRYRDLAGRAGSLQGLACGRRRRGCLGGACLGPWSLHSGIANRIGKATNDVSGRKE